MRLGSRGSMITELRRRAAEEQGFTLAELLAVIAIMGVIIGAIAMSLAVGLRTTNDTTVRLAESHDAQTTSAFLANDVQNAAAIASSACDGSGALLSLLDSTGGPLVSYHYGVAGNGERQIAREDCGSGARVVLAHRVGAATPTV